MARAENKESAGPTARLVAKMVLSIRKQRGWSQERLGQELGYSGAAVSALETLAQPPSDQMLMRLEAVLGEGSGFFLNAMVTIRRERYPAEFQRFAELERDAVSLLAFSMHTIHGLFQTEGYMRALFSGTYPLTSEARVEELVVGRMERKQLFDREPTAMIGVILDESVLTRMMGSVEVMRNQLLHLIECSERRNVTMQVLALDCGLDGEYAADRGPLTLIETRGHEHLAYMEIQDVSMLVDDPAAVSVYSQRYAKIRAQALSPRMSLDLIARLAGEQR
ncbi:Scr1 family TA system antitoxin-like transcriptional regulator [Streptomyces sp. NPDC058657]|uniref:helix-turn-helix domain-containing protein n=1 Tax=unclassified Streptomyces TaxID=2593676 RepID=UPI0036688A09